MIGGIIATARPRQWIKNLLVLAAPLASGDLSDVGALLAVGVAFVAFCLCASSIYLLNDSLDIEADRAHPKKRFRPIAAGEVPIAAAWASFVVLLVAGVALGFVVNVLLGLVLLVYCVVQIAYCFWLKHIAVLDIAVVSSGFLLRAVAGGAAAGIALSQWFLLVAIFGSLLMVAGKRYGEIVSDHEAAATRRSLKHYTPSYLRFIWQSAAAIVVIVYSLWTFEGEVAAGGDQRLAITIVPFVLAIFRYCQHIDSGDAEAPEEIAAHDRLLQVLAAVWLIVLFLCLYLP
ncbi:decaprenyl-phosphate phosphoribosyltransferase [Arenivirga flava]|uniref:Decaprenyl-phosphate phosphoribosyltransferase n=2 Tax=Arenivirga flava TaxID=1930060 RepID=A0AA37UH98_9MICO|nr:decaprenyl-phosphate phosphoribosyltransferase [Arenivirga flava]